MEHSCKSQLSSLPQVVKLMTTLLLTHISRSACTTGKWSYNSVSMDRQRTYLVMVLLFGIQERTMRLDQSLEAEISSLDLVSSLIPIVTIMESIV